MDQNPALTPMHPKHQVRRPPSAQDWEERREVVQRLYYTEGKPLREVMKIMKDEYGFYATYVSIPRSLWLLKTVHGRP